MYNIHHVWLVWQSLKVQLTDFLMLIWSPCWAYKLSVVESKYIYSCAALKAVLINILILIMDGITVCDVKQVTSSSQLYRSFSVSCRALLQLWFSLNIFINLILSNKAMINPLYTNHPAPKHRQSYQIAGEQLTYYWETLHSKAGFCF